MNRERASLIPIFALLVFGAVSVQSRAQERTGPTPTITAADERAFVDRVLPVLRSKCLACHGDDPDKIKGGLDLRSRAGALRGGDSGLAAIIPEEVENSPLLLAIGREADEFSPMPPKANDRLDDDQIAAFRSWVAAGAAWPTDARIAELAASRQWDDADGTPWKTSGGLADDWTNRRYKPADLWAFRPLATAAIPPRTIDSFLQDGLDAIHLTAAPAADRATLVRRLTFDLIGLPPTTEEIAAFVNDPAEEDTALARVVDRLLASPHHGEKMAQHWLDVARYADSAGLANDFERGTAWRYRDYVVRSFNEDRPYDRFVRDQIAGDELAPDDPEALIAVGFLRMGPWELTGMEVARVARQRYLDDVTDAVGQAFLAQPLQCARCHDHKFDPIPTRDHYAIQAVFATTQFADRPAPFLDAENREGFDEKRYLDARRVHLEQVLASVKSQQEAALRSWRAAHPGSDEANPQPERYLSPAQMGLERIARKGLERLAWRVDRYEPIALSVYSGATPDLKAVLAPLRLPSDRRQGQVEATAILPGGDPFSPTARVAPGVLSAANDGSTGAVPETLEGRRAAFARWVASASNPLTARVMVNRIWGWHFGTPLAGNPNNFGATGKKPTHPELLDALARAFIDSGWSVKAMHRMIVMSDAYRRSSRHPDLQAVAKLDPLGISYAVFRPRRLTAEEVRDAMLAATGELNRSVGGIPCRPELNPEVAFQPRQVMGTYAEAWQPSPEPSRRHRRSLYMLKLRGLRDPFFEVFNQPSPESSCELRDTSTIAPQAFALFNSTSSHARALALAARARAVAKDDDQTIDAMFRLTLGREPNDDERQAALAHWKAMTARHERLRFVAPEPVLEIIREVVDENSGEPFQFTEPLEMMADFVPDARPSDVPADVRGLAEIGLVLFNTNEFITVE
jgi:mono/diheme cytochrome c family protein